MQEKGTYDVFVSYSSKNKNVADAIVADFEQHGIRCWYAPRDIMPGTSWVSAITDALRMVKVQVLIYTDESNASRQVMNEVALAFNEGKTIVPFRLSETRMSDEFEYYLSRVHWLDAVTKSLADNITQLRNYVEVILLGVEKAHIAGSTQSGKKRGNAYVITLITATILLVSLLSLTAYLIFRDSGSEVQPDEPDAYITSESRTSGSDAYAGAGTSAQIANDNEDAVGIANARNTTDVGIAAGDSTNTSLGGNVSSEDNANTSIGGDATAGGNVSGASSGDIVTENSSNASSSGDTSAGGNFAASTNSAGTTSSGNSNTGSDGPASGSSSNNTPAGTASSGNNTATDGDNTGSGSNTSASGDVAKDIYDMTVDELETAAVKGEVAACELLGSMYYNGDKVDQNYGKARMYLERAVENGSTSAKVFKTLGDIYYYGKDVDESDEEAGRYYKKAIDMGASNYDTLANYGMILYRDDRFEESAVYFERSVELEPDPTTMYNAGLAYYGAGDSENAVKWLQEAIDNGFTRAKDAQKLIETIKE